MSTASIMDACRHGHAALARRSVPLRRLLVVLLVLGSSGGCRTPPPPKLRRQVDLAAKRRVIVSVESTRVRQGAGARTAPNTVSLVQGELDEAAVAQIALINNPGLAAEYANLGIARPVLLRAGQYSNPTVETSELFGDGQSHIVDMKAAHDIVHLALLPRRRQSDAQLFDAAKVRLCSRIMGVAHEARSTFIEYQTAGVLLEQERKLADDRATAMDAARGMAEKGKIPAAELAVLEQRCHATQLALAVLQVDARGKRATVNRVLGLHEDTEWKAQPAGNSVVATISISAESADRRTLDASLELAAQRSEIVALARQCGVEQTKLFVPELKVGVDSEREPDGAWAVGPALVLTVPLFDQGRRPRAAVDSQMLACWNRYVQTAVAIASATRAALTRMDAGQQALWTQLEEVVPLSRKALQETLQQHNSMLAGVFDVLRAQEQEIQARARLAELKREYRLAYLDLQYLLAGGEPAEGTSAGSTPHSTAFRRTLAQVRQ